MADYLIVVGENPNYGVQVEAKNIKAAIEDLDLEPGDKAVVYRLAAPPRTVSVVEEVKRRVHVE